MSVLMAMSMPMAAMLFTQLGRGSLPLQFILLIVGTESNEPKGCMYFRGLLHFKSDHQFCICAAARLGAVQHSGASRQWDRRSPPSTGAVGGAVAIAKGNGDGFGWTDNASTPEEAKAAALEMRLDVREFGWPCGL